MDCPAPLTAGKQSAAVESPRPLGRACAKGDNVDCGKDQPKRAQREQLRKQERCDGGECGGGGGECGRRARDHNRERAQLRIGRACVGVRVRDMDEMADGDTEDDGERERLDDAERERECTRGGEHGDEHADECTERSVHYSERARDEQHGGERNGGGPRERGREASEEDLLGRKQRPLGAARDTSASVAVEDAQPYVPLAPVARK
eukprot:scaffold158892_cov22-Tisochrysis_lutea.AAC.1